MADKKISQLTVATTPLAGTEVLPIVQGNATVKVPVNNLFETASSTKTGLLSSTDWSTFNGKASTSSPTFSGNVMFSTGNVVIGTSGKGIDFSATPGTGTSELLADYEEGTWTPTWNGGTVTVNSSSYIKVGSMVYLRIDVTFGSSISVSDSTLSLPFAMTENYGFGSITYTDYLTTAVPNPTSSNLYIRTAVNAGNASCSALAGKRLCVGIIYKG